MSTFRQPIEQIRSGCRNRVWMIASPRMAAAPDDRVVINAIPAQVWRADQNGTIQFVNEVWLDYTGLSLDQTLGWGWSTGDVIHADDLPGLLETWRRVLASGQPDEAEARVRRSDGEYRWFALLRPLADAAAQERVRDLVLQAYAEYEETATEAAS